MTKRNASLLVSVLVLVVVLIFVFRQPFGSVVLDPNKPPPQAGPTPCFVLGVGSAPPPDVCRVRCGPSFNGVPQSQNNAEDILCCPDGTTFGKTAAGKDTCVKVP